MVNKIRHGSSIPKSENLSDYQLGFHTTSGDLYIKQAGPDPDSYTDDDIIYLGGKTISGLVEEKVNKNFINQSLATTNLITENSGIPGTDNKIIQDITYNLSNDNVLTITKKAISIDGSGTDKYVTTIDVEQVLSDVLDDTFIPRDIAGAGNKVVQDITYNIIGSGDHTKLELIKTLLDLETGEKSQEFKAVGENAVDLGGLLVSGKLNKNFTTSVVTGITLTGDAGTGQLTLEYNYINPLTGVSDKATLAAIDLDELTGLDKFMEKAPFEGKDITGRTDGLSRSTYVRDVALDNGAITGTLKFTKTLRDVFTADSSLDMIVNISGDVTGTITKDASDENKYSLSLGVPELTTINNNLTTISGLVYNNISGDVYNNTSGITYIESEITGLAGDLSKKLDKTFVNDIMGGENPNNGIVQDITYDDLDFDYDKDANIKELIGKAATDLENPEEYRYIYLKKTIIHPDTNVVDYYSGIVPFITPKIFESKIREVESLVETSALYVVDYYTQEAELTGTFLEPTANDFFSSRDIEDKIGIRVIVKNDNHTENGEKPNDGESWLYIRAANKDPDGTGNVWEAVQVIESVIEEYTGDGDYIGINDHVVSFNSAKYDNKLLVSGNLMNGKTLNYYDTMGSGSSKQVKFYIDLSTLVIDEGTWDE